MAKQPRTKLSGKEARYVLKQNNISLAWLADIKEKDYPSFMCGVHYNIKATAKALGITKRISFYTARKSFVQHGFELGIPLETLEYCIGQTMKSNRPIFNYVKIMRQHADLAIRQVIDNLLNPES